MRSFACWLHLSGCPQTPKLSMWVLNPLVPRHVPSFLVRYAMWSPWVRSSQKCWYPPKPSFFLILHISSTTKYCLSYLLDIFTVYPFLCSLVPSHYHHISPRQWEQHPSSLASALSGTAWPFGYFYLQVWTCCFPVKSSSVLAYFP